MIDPLNEPGICRKKNQVKESFVQPRSFITPKDGVVNLWVRGLFRKMGRDVPALNDNSKAVRVITRQQI